MLAKDASGMQRDYWYTSSRNAADLQAAAEVGSIAAQRTLRRLGARQVATCETPVIFEANVACGLFSHFASAISGGSLYRKSSFLLDSLNTQVFADHISIHEQPHLPGAMGSSPFDGDGVATRANRFVEQGFLRSYSLGGYSARKLGLQTTGNASGMHNLTFSTSQLDLAGLLREMGTGLLVTDLMGFGVNAVTGDYSRGASGFWIEDGEIAFPVEEITIASNLKDMYRQIVAIGNDIETRGNIRSGSVLIDKMTLAGA
jgi:PmbA protein